MSSQMHLIYFTNILLVKPTGDHSNLFCCSDQIILVKKASEKTIRLKKNLQNYKCGHAKS